MVLGILHNHREVTVHVGHGSLNNTVVSIALNYVRQHDSAVEVAPHPT